MAASLAHSSAENVVNSFLKRPLVQGKKSPDENREGEVGARCDNEENKGEDDPSDDGQNFLLARY